MTTSFSKDFPQCNTMTFIGQGQVSTIPNNATIRLGVQTVGPNLTTLQSENAQISQAIINTLNQYGVSDIKTYQYLIEKNYIYENGTQIDNGYTVRNILEIELNNIEQVGRVIDTAVNNGANVVELVSFGISNKELYYQQALNMAVMNAIQKSKSVAMFLGLQTDPIPIHIVENSTTPIPFMQARTFGEGSFATPIEPGQYLTNAMVTVDFIY